MSDLSRPGHRRYAIASESVQSLYGHFMRTASDSAKYALTHWTDSDDEEGPMLAAIRAGMAVELLLLATLCKQSPALIASGAREAMHSRLYLAEAVGPAQVTAANLRTIEVQEAFRAVQVVHPQMKLDQFKFNELLGVRNAAVHSALVEREPLRAAIVTMSRMCEALLNAMGTNRGRFWGGGLLDVVTSLVLEAESITLATAQSKIAAAAAGLKELLSRLDPNRYEEFLLLMEERPSAINGEGEPYRVQCPACQRRAWVQLSLIPLAIQPEDIYADENGIAAVDQLREGYPFAFDCPVCGLLLEAEELSPFDIGNLVHLEPIRRYDFTFFSSDYPTYSLTPDSDGLT